MAVIEDILESLADQDAEVRDLRICLRATAVWTRRLGLAYTFPRVHHGRVSEQPKPRRLSEMSARELAKLALSEDRIDAAVGMAAINSLLDPSPEDLKTGNALELILRHGAGRSVTVVGHFPFVERLREKVEDLWVLELYPQDGDLPSEDAPEVIPRSDVVAITGTTLLNHTLEGLLELARGKTVILLGPTTPMTGVFFEHGVDHVCGSLVEDPDLALKCVSEGVSFRYTEGLKPVILSRP